MAPKFEEIFSNFSTPVTSVFPSVVGTWKMPLASWEHMLMALTIVGHKLARIKPVKIGTLLICQLFSECIQLVQFTPHQTLS